MTETQWAEDSPGKPMRKSLPKWVWFCGGGCLLALIAGLIAVVLFVRMVKNARDEKVTWPALQQVLAYDERPPTMHIELYTSVGIEQFVMRDDRGFQLQLQLHKGASGDRARKQMFEGTTPEFPADMGVMKFEDMRKGEVEVQGRVLPVVRCKLQFSGFAKSMVPKEAQDQMGDMLWTDVRPEGQSGMYLLQITRHGSSGEITDDELRELLAPFHIGPKR